MIVLKNLLARTVSPIAALSGLAFINAYLTDKQSDNVVFLLYIIFLISGWCSLSHRQKLLSEIHLAKINKRKSKLYIYSSAAMTTVIIASMCIDTFTLGLLKIERSFSLVFSLFLFLIASHLLALVYSNCWSRNKLHISYIADGSLNFSLIIGLLLHGAFGAPLVSTWSIIFLSLSIGFLISTRSHIQLNKLTMNKGIAASWVNSQLIAFISYFEVFLFADVSGKGMYEYRLAIVIASIFVTIAVVFRQTAIAKNKLELNKIFLYVCLGFSLLTFLYYWKMSPSSLTQSLIVFIIMSILQAIVSVYTYKLHSTNASHLVLLGTILTAVFALLLLYHGLAEVSPASVIGYKILLVCCNIVILSAIMIFYSTQNKPADNLREF